MEIQNLTFTNGLTFTTEGNPACQVVTDGLQVQLRPDSYTGDPGPVPNGSIWNDTQGNANGTIVNNPVYNSTTGFYFNPNLNPETFSPGDGVDLPSINGVTSFQSGQDFSLEVWVQPAGPGGQILDKGLFIDGTGPTYPISYEIFYGGRAFFRTFAEDPSYYFELVYPTPPDSLIQNNWYQLVCTYNWTTKNFTIFYNGIEFPTKADLTPLVGQTIHNNNKVTLAYSYGTGGPFAPTFNRFKGGIGIFRIYNKALTLREVKANFCADRNTFGI